jgi:lysophospholipase L1-like esterase
VALAVQAASDDGDGGAGGADAAPDIAVVGDSLIEQSRDQMQAHADAQGLIVESVAFGGSAPCDWMDAFEDFAAVGPEHLVISFAGNDNTPCIHPGGGPPRDPQTIADAYAEMMPGILDQFEGLGTEVYVVLPPPVGPPASEPAAAAIRATYRDLAADRPWVTIVDPAPLLGPDGAFHQTLPCETWEAAVCAPDGTVAVRNADGIHLTPAGGERYARVLLDAIGHPVEG